MAGKKVTSKGAKFGLPGGKTKMFGKQGADPADPGKISVSDPANGQKWAKGGSTKMFGYTGSKPARAA